MQSVRQNLTESFDLLPPAYVVYVVPLIPVIIQCVSGLFYSFGLPKFLDLALINHELPLYIFFYFQLFILSGYLFSVYIE